MPETVSFREAKQNGLVFKGGATGVRGEVTQSSGPGWAVSQMGVDGWDPNGNPEPKVSQSAEGTVVKQDRVINAKSG